MFVHSRELKNATSKIWTSRFSYFNHDADFYIKGYIYHMASFCIFSQHPIRPVFDVTSCVIFVMRFWLLLHNFKAKLGWSGGAMVLGELPVPDILLIWITIGKGLLRLQVGVGGVVWTFFLLPIISLSFWETARFRLKYCLKGPLSQKQRTN